MGFLNQCWLGLIAPKVSALIFIKVKDKVSLEHMKIALSVGLQRERGWVGMSLLCSSETSVSHIFVAENRTRHMGWILIIPLFLFHKSLNLEIHFNHWLIGRNKRYRKGLKVIKHLDKILVWCTGVLPT